MTLIKVCMCLCHEGRCRAQEEKGIVIELRVIEFTGVCGSNHLTFERVLSNRPALQFGWSISPTGLKVNGTNTDTPGLEKTSPRTNTIDAGFFGLLLGVASGWFTVGVYVSSFLLGLSDWSELRNKNPKLWYFLPPCAKCLTSTHLPLVENGEHLPVHTNVQWFSPRHPPSPPPLQASLGRMLMALSEFTCALWCWPS